MGWAKIIILQLAVEDFVVAGVYAGMGDWARAAYWACAGAIGLTTLFM